MAQRSRSERAAIVVNECWAVADTRGPTAARSVLWRSVVRDPWLVRYRPVLGALRRLYGIARQAEGKQESNSMTAGERVERLIRESPKLHFLPEGDARWLAGRGFKVQAGPTSWAVPPQVLRYFAATVESTHLTIETGAGHSTVALAALARHHTCITTDEYCVDATRRYMDELAIPQSKVTFIVESSDTALPKLRIRDKFDFAYVDGEHGYPYAALDWHYLDRHMKVGGIVGFDNVEIPSVHNHCEFLEINRSYRLVQNISEPSLGAYGAYFYVKLLDQERSAGAQPYNHRRVTGLFPQDQAFWPWN